MIALNAGQPGDAAVESPLSAKIIRRDVSDADAAHATAELDRVRTLLDLGKVT